MTERRCEETESMIHSYTCKSLNTPGVEPDIADNTRQLLPEKGSLVEFSDKHKPADAWPKHCPKCHQTKDFLVHRVETFSGTRDADSYFNIDDTEPTYYLPHWVECLECGREGELQEFMQG